jgi:hypothetical protein
METATQKYVYLVARARSGMQRALSRGINVARDGCFGVAVMGRRKVFSSFGKRIGELSMKRVTVPKWYLLLMDMFVFMNKRLVNDWPSCRMVSLPTEPRVQWRTLMSVESAFSGLVVPWISIPLKWYGSG